MELNPSELESPRANRLILIHFGPSQTTKAFDDAQSQGPLGQSSGRGICLFTSNTEVDAANSSILLLMTDVDGAVSTVFDRVCNGPFIG